MAQTYQENQALPYQNALGFLKDQATYDLYLSHEAKINYFGAGANYEDDQW